MATESTTIDLGMIRPDAAETSSGWSTRRHLRWWLARLRRWASHRSWWSAAAVAGLMLPAVAAAAPPHPPWLTAHFSVPAGPVAGRFQLTEQTLYVSGRTSLHAATLTAYRLADGAVLWEIRHPDTYFWAGAPVLMSYQPGSTPRATVLDPVTGERRWRGRGLLAVVDDRILVRGQPEPQRASFPLTALDLTTGDQVWTLPAVRNRGFAIYYGEEGDHRLIAATGDGWLASYDLATGARLATAAGPPLPGVASLTVAGRLALVEPAEEPGLIAYDVDTLAPVWSIDSGAETWTFAGCGQVVCVDRGDGAPYAVDSATGEPVWSAGWFAGDRYGLREIGPSWLPGHLLLHDDPDGRPFSPSLGRIPQWLVDAGTGEPVLSLRGWWPQPRVPTGAGAAGTAGDPSAPILTRHEPGRTGTGGVDARGAARPGGRTWFARLHLDPAGIEVLGAAGSQPSRCVLGTHHLACQDRDEIQVWRVR